MPAVQVFCKLAVEQGVVPRGGVWSWPQCLQTAAGLLPYAFEKEDAKEKVSPAVPAVSAVPAVPATAAC